MFLIDVVVIVVLLVALAKQGSRISRLEQTVFGSTAPQKAPEASVSEAPAPVPVPAPSAVPVKPVAPVHDEASSGRVLAVLGIIAVFVGTAFFLRYAFQNNWVGPAGRVMLGLLGGAILLGIGQYLRRKYLEYSDFLMGGGLALFYLSLFSAHFFYHLVSPFTSWFFMALVTAFGFFLSVKNATKNLAVIATIGGFATPFLASSGGDSMFALFAYLTLLNIGVLAVSSFKKWPELPFAAFIGTVLNFGFWYAGFYTPILLAPALSFVFVSFLIFLASSVARLVIAKEKADQGEYLSLGGNAAYLAITGYIMIEPAHHALLGTAAVFIAGIYGVVAFMVNARNREDRSLNIFLPGLAVTFLSIAVPMQFDGSWIAVGWLVESLALYIISIYAGSRGFQAMGAVSYVLGIVGFIASMPFSGGPAFVPIFNGDFGVLALAIFIAYAIAYFYHRYGSVDVETQKRGISAFVGIANVLTIYAVSSQIIFYFDQIGTASAQNYSNTLVSIFWALYAALLTAVGFTKRIAGIRRFGLILFILTGIKVVIDIWSLGQVYRIVSLIVFGVIALSASFAYAKYKDRLKEIV